MGSKLTYNKFFIFLLFLLPFSMMGSIAQGQEKKIQVSGTVTSVDNKPVSGVTVVLQGTYIGTSTDAEGKYTISVPQNNSRLTFTCLGFKTVEQAVKGSTLNVIIEEIIQELDDVVVVGYGVQRKADLTGAITSVAAKDIEAQSPINVFDAIQGQVAGVEIVTGSGAPGEGANVRVRGTATFESGANPLYVVDGVIYDDIDDLDPKDIESIDVLKDAASAAIYGSRSANGVFLITTKQGGATTSLKASYLRSYSNLTRKMPAANAADRKYYDAVRRQVSSQRNSDNYGYTITDSLAYLTNQNMDMQDLVFQTAVRDEITLSGSGSSARFKYYLNAGYLSEEGIIVNSAYNRITSRVNTTFSPTDKLSFNSRLSFSYSDKDGTDESGVLLQMLQRIPYWAIFNPDGSYVPNIGRTNPYATAMTDVNKQQNYKAVIYQDVNYKFNEALKFNTNVQVNYNHRRSQFYRMSPQLSSTQRTEGTDNTSLKYGWTNENYFNYKQSFCKIHTVDAVVGCGFYFWRTETQRQTGLNYSTDEIYTTNAASEFDIKNTRTGISENTMASFFTRVGYNYRSKYLFNANLRYDGSSRFGQNNSWGAFPSASAAWRFSDEKFNAWMKPFVFDGKLRVSYGITGNEAMGNYDAWSLYSPNYIYQDETGNYVTGIGQSRLGYDGLGWEETSQFNVGLDLRLMKNRINITFDYYKKKTDNLLAVVEIPKETGFSTVRMNVGAMTNEGFELAATWNPIRTKKLRWTLSANISTNVSKITRLADGIPFYRGTDNAIYAYEGARLGEFWGYKYQGVFRYDESNAFTEDWKQLTPHFDTNGSFSHYTLNGNVYSGIIKQKRSATLLTSDPNSDILKGGDVNFEDVNRDGVIDLLDKSYIGCAQPDFFGGASSTLTWKNVSLYVSIGYSIGGQIYNYGEANRNRFRQDGATPSPIAIHNMWTKPGDDARYPSPIVSEHNMLNPSDFYLEDGSYIKLKSVKLTYSIPSSILKKISIKALSVYVYGKNLLTLTDYTGYDPEFSDSSDPLTLGIDPNRYPRKRELGFGLSFDF